MTAIKPYFDDGQVSLYAGDCREILPALGITADLVVADPPYSETGLAWDRWPDGWLDAVAGVARSMWCWLPFRQFAAAPFRGREFTHAGWRLSHDAEAEWDHLTWEKNTGSSPAADRLRRVHEPVSHWYRGPWGNIYRNVPRLAHDGPFKGTVRTGRTAGGHLSGGALGDVAWTDDGKRAARTILRSANLRGKAIHPTQKPVDVLEVLIAYGCPSGGLVVAPYAGSGSDLDAARNLGCRAIGVELDEETCEKAARRLERRADTAHRETVA